MEPKDQLDWQRQAYIARSDDSGWILLILAFALGIFILGSIGRAGQLIALALVALVCAVVAYRLRSRLKP